MPGVTVGFGDQLLHTGGGFACRTCCSGPSRIRSFGYECLIDSECRPFFESFFELVGYDLLVDSHRRLVAIMPPARGEESELPTMRVDETIAMLLCRARFTGFIEQNDQDHLRDMRDPKAYWRFNTRIENSLTGEVMSTVTRRMRSGSGGEGTIPQYIAMVSAVLARALSVRRDKGALPVVLFDEAFSQLDVEHTAKILRFMRDLGLQIILAAPDGKVRHVAHGVDTLVNVLREKNSNVVSIVIETLTDELREELFGEDPLAEGLSGFKARHPLPEEGSSDGSTAMKVPARLPNLTIQEAGHA